jgi:hypothetical protein
MGLEAHQARSIRFPFENATVGASTPTASSLNTVPVIELGRKVVQPFKP